MTSRYPIVRSLNESVALPDGQNLTARYGSGPEIRPGEVNFYVAKSGGLTDFLSTGTISFTPMASTSLFESPSPFEWTTTAVSKVKKELPAPAANTSRTSTDGGVQRNLARKTIADYIEKQFSKVIPTVGLAAAITYTNHLVDPAAYISVPPPTLRAWIDRSGDATWDPRSTKSAFEAITASTNRDDLSRMLKAQSLDRTESAKSIIAEITSWSGMERNWDSEGAAAPDASSLKAAESFVGLLGKDYLLPEPMLLASGHAGLYWNEIDLYADLEFLADGRIAYFVEHRGEGRHKGVVKFDSRKIPIVFQALLRNQAAV